MFFKLLLLSAISMTLVVSGFAIRMLFTANGKFPDTHVSTNPEMRKRGLSCAQQADTGCHSTEGFPGCSACS